MEYCGDEILFIHCTLTGSAGGGYYCDFDSAPPSFLRCTFGAAESAALLYRGDISTDDCTWSDDISFYPDVEWNAEEMDPAESKVVPFDEGVLTSTYWFGWQFTDTNTDVTRRLPDEDPDGNDIQFYLSFTQNGSGWLEGYEGRDIAFTWSCDSDYTALMDLEGSDKQGSVSLHYQEFSDGSHGVMWLMLYLDGLQIWCY